MDHCLTMILRGFPANLSIFRSRVWKNHDEAADRVQQTATSAAGTPTHARPRNMRLRPVLHAKTRRKRIPAGLLPSESGWCHPL
jgi:hypothetical protein